MTVVSNTMLVNANTEFTKDFSIAKDRAMASQGWPLITRKITSKTRKNTYTGFGAAPQMQNITADGELELDTPYHFDYTLENQVFKGGFKVERAAFEDDELGEIPDLITDLAKEAAAHPGRLVMQLLTDNGLAFDGVSFFNTTRVIGESANVNNTLALGGTTAALIAADIATLRGTMALFQDDKGIAMNLNPTHFVVRPEMAQAFYAALNTDQTLAANPQLPADNQVQFLRGGYTVVVSPLIPANKWFAFSVGGGTKYPLIYQERIAPHIEPLADLTSELAILRDLFAWTARGRYVAGYGDPRTGFRVG